LNSIRLNVFVAKATGLSRREADKVIQSGMVNFNGNLVREPFIQVTPSDEVYFKGTLLQAEHPLLYIIMHKPIGVVCSHQAQGGDQSIFDLLPPEYESLRFAGRLDKNSRGLVFLTNDYPLIHKLTHPSFQIPKTYRVVTDRPIEAQDIAILHKGGVLPDGDAWAPIKVLRVQQDRIHMVLREGKKREIRRIMTALGYHVQDLYRYEFAGLLLGELPTGKYRPLTNAEKDRLLT
jgi:23S rRNA pseudouridine2605 synthase